MLAQDSDFIKGLLHGRQSFSGDGFERYLSHTFISFLIFQCGMKLFVYTSLHTCDISL